MEDPEEENGRRQNNHKNHMRRVTFDQMQNKWSVVDQDEARLKNVVKLKERDQTRRWQKPQKKKTRFAGRSRRRKSSDATRR